LAAYWGTARGKRHKGLHGPAEHGFKSLVAGARQVAHLAGQIGAITAFVNHVF
jgi:hypothetical protein